MKLATHAEITGKEEAEVVKKILDHRGDTSNREYLVKWKGEEEESWVKASDFDAHHIIQDYWKEKQPPKQKGKEKQPLKRKAKENVAKSVPEKDSSKKSQPKPGELPTSRTGRTLRPSVRIRDG